MNAKWVLALLAPVCLAQTWEMGAAAGGGIGRSAKYGTALGGVAPGPAFGGLLGQDWGDRFGGEIRYTFLMQDLRLTSGSTEVKFGAQQHALHYQLMVYSGSRSSRVRAYALGGGGYKGYRGTGEEVAYRSLMDQALLTKTSEWKPMIVAGGGVKVALSTKVWLRFEVADQMTQAPNKVITPAAGRDASGWVHDIVPMVAISYRFGK